jgi:hypothetical protein
MKQKTYYHIILDQSGSMQDCLQSTISGFNEQLQVIRSLEGRFPEQEIRLGLTRFNEEVMHTYFARPADRVAKLTSAIYHPNGSTALYDAIGLSTQKLKDSIELELIAGLATVVVVILTDGYENSSRYYNLNQVKGLIRELEATGKWTFSYLGATLDAVEIAASLNIQQENSMSFHKADIRQTFDWLGTSMGGYLKRRREGKNTGGFLNPKD